MREHAWAAAILAAVAGFLTWLAVTADDRLQVPPAVALLCAFALAVAAARVLQLRARPDSAGHGFAVLILAAMAAVGVWIALWPGPRACTVAAMDVPIGAERGWRCRVPFGVGAAISGAMAAYALRVWLRGRPRRDES